MALDLEIGAATIFMEASNQGEEGMIAVAHVLMNRVSDGHWGHSVSEVCLWPSQFSSWNTMDQNRQRMAKIPDTDPIWVKARSIMQAALADVGEDPTLGACFYFADSIPIPDWAKRMTKTVQIGNHIFYKDIIHG